MVKLTTKYLCRRVCKSSQLQPRKKNESDRDYLKKMTHLYLQSQFIDRILNMTECPAVEVIYLQNNLLQSIHSLEAFPNVTHLYLQHNYIKKIENLELLTSLKKLYLGHNEISVVEGLDQLKNLTELHLESQRLHPGETLYFDPFTMASLGENLKVLNIGNNNVTAMESLADLFSLNTLIIEDNALNDLEDVAVTLPSLRSLETLRSEGNPISKNRKYLDTVIVSSKSLKSLDGKNIDEATRIFITKLNKNKEFRRRTSELSSGNVDFPVMFPRSRGDTSSSTEAGYVNLPSGLRSKMFPILKENSKSDRNSKTLSSASSKRLSSVFQNAIKVTNLSDSASYYL